MKYLRLYCLFVNSESNLEDITTSYAPGIILIFSILKLNENSLSVSPTTIANSLDVSFFLSWTISLICPFSLIAERSGS